MVTEPDTSPDPPVENDPTEPLPVLRHHLHEAALALDDAYTMIAAEDVAASIRDGQAVTRPSHLAGRLSRSTTTLAGYLGLRDDEEPDGGQSDTR